MSVRKILDSERWKRRRPRRLKAFAPMATNPALALTVNKTSGAQSNERASITDQRRSTACASSSSVTTVSGKNRGCVLSKQLRTCSATTIRPSPSMKPPQL